MRRRADARVELRAAYDVLAEVQADAFARRAERELLAAGFRAESRSADSSPLTHQEHAVARLAADGATNAEIGAALFITANTVDYHLKKVFRRLGITS